MMDKSTRRLPRYQGPVRAVIFDWAGTVVDHGSMAPVTAFLELFHRHGVTVTAEEARRPMGTYKKDHVRQILAMERVAAQWRKLNGRAPSPEDVEHLYRQFVPLQTEVIGRHGDVIPGVAQTMDWLRRQGIHTGSTTGYTREMMVPLVPLAAGGGFAPEATVCADEVPAGRPAPWMALTAAMRLGVYPMEACVKVGDTLADIAEGMNAGMWTVGVTRTGNELGLTLDEVESLPAEDLASRLEAASERMRQAGAHYVVEGVRQLPRIITDIGKRLVRGARP